MVIAIAAVLLGATLFMVRKPILLAIGDFLVVEDELHPADIIHVLAGGERRTDYAIQLYNQGYGKQIFMTGGWCSVINGSHAERGRERALEQGVPPEDIVVDGSPVSSTYSEAVRLKEFIAHSQMPIRSVVVVSDPYHLRRARWAFRQEVGSKASIKMAPVPYDLSSYQRHWWADGASRRMVGGEYLKIAFYYIRYGFNWGPLGKWLATCDISCAALMV
jgi:uncharacterized SAM-binding protein YcdF (DUF218 family)